MTDDAVFTHYDYWCLAGEIGLTDDLVHAVLRSCVGETTLRDALVRLAKEQSKVRKELIDRMIEFQMQNPRPVQFILPQGPLK